MDLTAARSKRYADLCRYTAAEYPHIIVHDSLPVRLQFYVGDVPRNVIPPMPFGPG